MTAGYEDVRRPLPPTALCAECHVRSLPARPLHAANCSRRADMAVTR